MSKLAIIIDAVAANPEQGMILLLEELGEDHAAMKETAAVYAESVGQPIPERNRAAAEALQKSDSLIAQSIGRLIAWAESNYYEAPPRRRGRRGRNE